MVSGKRILILTPLDERLRFTSLEEQGFILSFSQDPSVVQAIPLEDMPDLVVLDFSLLAPEDQRPFVERCKEEQIILLTVVAEEIASSFDPTLGVEDFVFTPLRDGELRARVRRVLWRTKGWDSGEVIRAGDLTIDQERYEVSVAGRRVILTFKL